jgi:DNA polymerase sigma
MYGINEVPVTLEDDQYDDFFRLSNQYVRKWKSKNTTSAEILFLQFLSYYTEKFDTEQFVISIQTRMPILKIGKKWRKKLLACQGSVVIHFLSI